MAAGPVGRGVEPELIARIRTAPKVELHLHLDGAMPRAWLLERVRRRDASIGSLADLDARLAFDTFAEFIERWGWKCGFLDRYADFESLAESVLTDLADHGVVHVEPFFSPGDYERRHGLAAAGLVEAVLEGAHRAAARTGIGFGLIVDLVRDHGPAVAARRLEEVTPYRGQGVVGIGLGGSEDRFPPAPFAEVYAEAARRGFRRTAHAGEAAGPASVRGALAALGAERIGHGITVIEDAALVGHLARERVPLEVCPTSNVRTGVVPGYAAHPLRRLFEAGVPVSVHSDDPTFFGATLVDEYVRCVTDLGFAPAELATLAANAAAAAFLPDEARGHLVARVRDGWRAVGL
jgi:adenosine deaminase